MAIDADEWNAIRDLITQMLPAKTMTFGKVIKRDPIQKLVWLTEFGDTPIPLVDFERGFSYYDTQPTGANVTAGVPLPTKLVKKTDATDKDPAYQTHIITPEVGDIVIVETPWGNQRFPICIGKILSTGHWTGEE